MSEPIDQVLNGSPIDRVLQAFAGDNAPKGIDPMMGLLISVMSTNAQAAQQAAQRQAEQQQAAQQAQMQMLLAIIGPLMSKPPIDPVMLALLTKDNGSESFKNMLEMQRQQSAQSMDSLRTALLSVMETKDSINKDMLERALESSLGGGEESMGQTVLKLLPSLLSQQQPPAQTPAQTPETIATQPLPGAAASAAHPPAGAARQPAPVVVVMRGLMALQRGTASKPNATAAAIVSVAFQDDQLIAALQSEDLGTVLTYVAPRISAEPAILAWLAEPEVEPWLTHYVDNRLIPQVLDVIDPDGGDDEEDDAEPGPAKPTPVAPAKPTPAAPIKPAAAANHVVAGKA